MGKNISTYHLGIVVMLGAVWGLSEAGLGMGLRSCASFVSGSIMTGVALFFIAAALLLIASLGFWRIKEISVFNSEGNGLVKFLHTITHEIRTNKKFKTYLYFVNTQGISIALMPFLILYAKENISAESHDIGNFLLLKVIGSVLTGSLLLYFSKKAKYRHMMVTTSVVAILIPLFLLILPGSTLFPYIFLAGGLVFTIYTISINGVLLEITSNENRALYTGLSGAGGILPVTFPFFGGWIITEFGFTLFFILFICIIALSFYFIYKMDCKK